MSAERRRYWMRKRDERVCEGFCINGESHGIATHGVCCLACRETHRGHRLESTLGVEKYRELLRESQSGGRTLTQIAKEYGCLIEPKRRAA